MELPNAPDEKPQSLRSSFDICVSEDQAAGNKPESPEFPDMFK
jgi:hypothetical protein